ncbi:hypothetical protein BDC45DRAFT_530148 [Circinella umbellata]|nr:hypothetical protein BDC45DRAFT_530148 [Circinella umbellata]
MKGTTSSCLLAAYTHNLSNRVFLFIFECLPLYQLSYDRLVDMTRCVVVSFGQTKEKVHVIRDLEFDPWVTLQQGKLYHVSDISNFWVHFNPLQLLLPFYIYGYEFNRKIRVVRERSFLNVVRYTSILHLR